jgi:MFS family permease
MTAPPVPRVRFRPLSLDALNFLLADVRGALGPFLNVFLVTQQGWSQSSVGLVTAVAGLVGLAAQTPAGAAIDATRAKRGALVVALAVLACGAIAIFAAPSFWPVLAANTLIAIVGDVFGPAVAALTLGLFMREQLAGRMGRNAACDHAGNVVIALVAAAIGSLFGQRAVFLLVPVFAILAILAVLSIPAAAIDHRRARGAEPNGAAQQGAGWRTILECRPLAVYAGCTMLFHFANAPLLPLVGQKLALANKELATAMMSSCIIAAQLVMLPIALFAGRRADRWGRKPILLIGFAILPVRAFLYILSYIVEQRRMADRGPASRWRWRRDLWGIDAARHCRPDARDRPLQFGVRGGRHGARHRRVAWRLCRRPDRRPFRIQRGVFDLRRGVRDRTDSSFSADAGNRACSVAAPQCH